MKFIRKLLAALHRKPTSLPIAQELRAIEEARVHWGDLPAHLIDSPPTSSAAYLERAGQAGLEISGPEF